MRIVLHQYSQQAQVELNAFITNYELNQSIDDIAAKLSFSIINNPYDNELSNLIPQIEVGDFVSMFSDMDDPIPNYLAFYGRIQNLEKGNQQGTVTYVCYDQLYNLGASTSNKIFNAPAEVITAQIATECGITLTYAEPTGINIGKQVFEDTTYYDMIKKSYELAGKALNTKYYIHMDGAGLGVLPLGYPLCVNKLSDGANDPEYYNSSYSNILRAHKDVNASQIINLVKAYDENGTQIGELRDDESITHYGLKETVYHKEDNVSVQDGMNALLKKEPQESISVQAIGNWQWWAGRSIIVHDKETDLEGQYIIKRVQHNFEGNHYTSNLELEFMEGGVNTTT